MCRKNSLHCELRPYTWSVWNVTDIPAISARSRQNTALTGVMSAVQTTVIAREIRGSQRRNLQFSDAGNSVWRNDNNNSNKASNTRYICHRVAFLVFEIKRFCERRASDCPWIFVESRSPVLASLWGHAKNSLLAIIAFTRWFRWLRHDQRSY